MILLMLIKVGFAQVPATTRAIFTADSIVSGNSKDILTSFYQLALNNLTGKNREFNFSSNPFAIMLRRNPKLSLDTKYTRYKPLRKLNFNLGLKLDSVFNFNGFTSGIKYSLIDQTDATASKFIFERLRSDALNAERNILAKKMRDYANVKFPNAVGNPDSEDFKKKGEFMSKADDLFIKDIPFSKFDAEFQKDVNKIVEDNKLEKVADIFKNKPDSSFKDIDFRKFQALKNAIKNNLLWTIGISDSTYKDKFQFTNIAIFSELSKGIFQPEPGDNNLEINVKAAYNFLKDTLKPGRNLKREIFTVESGLNWVIRDKTTDRSFAEIKFSGSYYHNFASIYQNEKRDSLTLNGTLRIRVVDDLWIPLEVKYDPKTGNVFGVLNMKANFTGLAKLLKPKT